MMDIERLPTVHGASIPDEAYEQQQQALRGFAATFLRDGAQVDQAKYFLVPADTRWVAVVSEVGGQIESGGAMERQRFDWHRPGYELIEVWKGDKGHLAIAMAYDPMPDGRRLLGYFKLDR